MFVGGLLACPASTFFSFVRLAIRLFGCKVRHVSRMMLA
ncbi:MAG TPA: hypothetical protein DEF41_01460 [Desulfovibrio sp.]|uniref:Uncharacterized protein n=1 Tax=Nitratidesulfovibrio vulgaris (strain ATCC 29579 / DSM 644 / CCUG 34227 / NCIMB 8303 / VKM B-1760 / Hildenborough) TaxID=882 RepID=Q72DX7_NITV2|nr:hypothetical protein DVU_0802 [Nitratidesulfovibrio vulgaris str. Hildenborough]HBW14825.1 hypothetical protein [Desulfovibrio sp.]